MLKVKSFKKHVGRAYSQLYIWRSAHLSVINPLDPLQYGWEKQEKVYLPSTTEDPLAPGAVIEMVSCKSCKLCTDGKCLCRLVNQSCYSLFVYLYVCFVLNVSFYLNSML